jgi:hypothetical protein
MRLDSTENGMFSLVMVVVVIAMMVLAVLVVELGRFAGFRDWAQGIVDDAAHQAIVRALTADQVRTDVQNEILRSGLTKDLADIVVSGRFAGMLLPLLSNLVGQLEAAIPFSVQARAQSQRSRVLLILDRYIAHPLDGCQSDGWIAMTTFADRLVLGLDQSGFVSSVVGVVPGDSEVVDVVARDGSDGLRRCESKRSESGFELRGIAGSPQIVDAWNAASAVRDLALRELFSEPHESLMVVVLMRREAQFAGFATRLREFLEQASQSVLLYLGTVAMAGFTGSWECHSASYRERASLVLWCGKFETVWPWSFRSIS